MISVAVSAISLVVIVVVTVVLVNRSYQEESLRKADLRKVVDQVNSTHDSALAVENQQNTTLTGVNTSIAALRGDVDVVKKEYAKKADLANEVVSKKGSFDSVVLGGKGSIAYDEKAGFSLKEGETAVMGFGGGGKKLLVGSELSLSQDDKGDVRVGTVGDKARLMLQNAAGPGLVLKGNKVGIGADPANGELDVAGSMAVKDNIYMGVDKDGKPRRALASGADGIFRVNPDKAYSQVSMESDVVFGGNVMLKAGGITGADGKGGLSFVNGKVGIIGDAAFTGNTMFLGPSGAPVISGEGDSLVINKDGRFNKVQINGEVSFATGEGKTAKFTDPTRIEFHAGSTNGVPLQGPTFVVGEYTEDATSSTVIGSRTYGVATADKLVSPMGVVDNQVSKRGVFTNNNDDGWTVMHNDNNDLVFAPSTMTTNTSSGTETGVFNLYKDGTVMSQGDGRFTGMVSSLGNVLAKGNVEGRNVCLTTDGGPLCLEQEELNYIKMLNAQAKSGTQFATRTDVTNLTNQIVGLQDQLRALNIGI